MSIVPPTRPHITCFFTDFTDCFYEGPTSLYLAADWLSQSGGCWLVQVLTITKHHVTLLRVTNLIFKILFLLFYQFYSV